MIVTIDGPAGAGKSHVARALAARLGFKFLDTGAMYRAVALSALQRDVAWDDGQALARLSADMRIALEGDRVLLEGIDVSEEIRRSEVTAAVHFAADNPQVREQLVDLQRKLAAGQDTITEGRDQGTVVFPRAECKIFLTASAEERARRRCRDLQSLGEAADFAAVLAQQNQRDQRDMNRAVGRLVRPHDAIEICTDGLTADQVVDRIEQIVRDRSGRSQH